MLPASPAAGAEQSGVVTDRPLAGPKSVGDVRDYWTRERMREATPREITASGGASRVDGTSAGASAAGGLSAEAAAVEQPDTTSYPNRVVGKVFFTQPGVGNFVCSASVINTDTDAFVLTAGHCVEEGGVFATNWMFVPGYRGGAEPFGEFVATQLMVPSQSPSLSFDHGAAIVAPSPSGQNVEDVVGAFGIALFEASSQNWRAYGYPAAAPFDGERLYTCDSPTELLDITLFPPPVGISCDMTGGASGGPWVIRDVLVASNSSYGIVGIPDIVFGPQFQDGAAELFDAAHSASCGGRLPLIVGTEGPDRLVGTKRRDVILGDLGHDVILGKGGKDWLCGEEDADTLKGGKGKDFCDGGQSADTARRCEKTKRL